MMKKFDTIHVFNINHDNAWTSNPFQKSKGKRKVKNSLESLEVKTKKPKQVN